MKRLLLFAMTALLISSCSEKKNYSFKNNTLHIDLGSKQFQMSALNPDVIKVGYTGSRSTANGVFVPDLSIPFPLLFQESETKLILSTENVAVHIELTPFKIMYLDRVDGLKSIQTHALMIQGDHMSIGFQLEPDEKIYGTAGGASSLKQRDYRFLHYDPPQYGFENNADSLNYPFPYIISSANYMILFDHPIKGCFDSGYSSADLLYFSSENGNMTYYFINADTPDELLKNYTNVTGHQDLPPI